jgi:hypothetical protein
MEFPEGVMETHLRREKAPELDEKWRDGKRFPFPLNEIS